ncbi:MAG: hypothetical protein KGL39_43625 [Patescibacteria group bacterium]|nr:hypothetical protein [Patescibacteria group bacterium]
MLLAELDDAIQSYLGTCRQLGPDSGICHTDAVNLGIEKEHQRSIIIGIAWNLNKASTGREDA